MQIAVRPRIGLLELVADSQKQHTRVGCLKPVRQVHHTVVPRDITMKMVMVSQPQLFNYRARHVRPPAPATVVQKIYTIAMSQRVYQSQTIRVHMNLQKIVAIKWI